MGETRITTALHATTDLAQAVTTLVQQLSTTAAPITVESLAKLIESESATLLIASTDEGVVGMLTLITYTIPTGVRARIEDVVVNESARGKGIAFELTHTAVELARQAGARTIDLTSRPSRESANRLYQRAGFTPRDSLTYRQTLATTDPATLTRTYGHPRTREEGDHLIGAFFVANRDKR